MFGKILFVTGIFISFFTISSVFAMQKGYEKGLDPERSETSSIIVKSSDEKETSDAKRMMTHIPVTEESGLDRLPGEVLVMILDYLDIEDLEDVPLINKFFATNGTVLTSNASAWKKLCGVSKL